jgi:hypothetical protein
LDVSVALAARLEAVGVEEAAMQNPALRAAGHVRDGNPLTDWQALVQSEALPESVNLFEAPFCGIY